VDEYKAFQPPASVLEDVPETPLELAQRGTRLGAVILDGLVFATSGIVAAITIPIAIAWRAESSSMILPLVILGLWVTGLIIWNVIWVHKYGQTIGKRILKIRVVRSNGERASLGRIFFLRYFVLALAGAVPFIGGIITLVDTLLIFRDNCQCLHDQLADTIVINAGA